MPAGRLLGREDLVVAHAENGAQPRRIIDLVLEDFPVVDAVIDRLERERVAPRRRASGDPQAGAPPACRPFAPARPTPAAFRLVFFRLAIDAGIVGPCCIVGVSRERRFVSCVSARVPRGVASRATQSFRSVKRSDSGVGGQRRVEQLAAFLQVAQRVLQLASASPPAGWPRSRTAGSRRRRGRNRTVHRVGGAAFRQALLVDAAARETTAAGRTAAGARSPPRARRARSGGGRTGGGLGDGLRLGSPGRRAPAGRRPAARRSART